MSDNIAQVVGLLLRIAKHDAAGSDENMGVKNLSRQRVALDMGSRVEVSVAEPLNDVISGIRSPDVVGRIDHLKQSPAEDFVPVKNAVADGLSIAVGNRCRQGEH